MGPGGILPTTHIHLPQIRSDSAAPEAEPVPREIDTPDRLKFAKDSAGFLNELKRRVDGYFIRTGKNPNDCWQMYLKTAIIMAWYLGSYIALVFFAEGPLQAVPLAISLGVAMAAVG